MKLSNFNYNTTGIILVLLGLLALSFPMTSTWTIGIVAGFMFLMVALLLFVTGVSFFLYSKILGIITIILAVMCMIFSWNLMFSPDLVAFITSFVVYLLGIVMIITGIFSLISATIVTHMKYIGIVTLIFGIIIILFGIFVNDPVNLGMIIGIWLIISGIIQLFNKEPKDYIDV